MFCFLVTVSLNTVSEVRHSQENLLRIAPKEAKANLPIDNAPAHSDAEKLVSADG